METRAVAAKAAMPAVLSVGTRERDPERARSATPSAARTRMTTPNQTGPRGRCSASPFLGSSSSSSSRRMRSLSRSRGDDAGSRAVGLASRAASRGRSTRMHAYPARDPTPMDPATPTSTRCAAEKEEESIDAPRRSRAPAEEGKPLSERVRAMSAASVRAALAKVQQRHRARSRTQPAEPQPHKRESALQGDAECSRDAAKGDLAVNPLYAPLAAWGESPVTPRGSPAASWTRSSPRLDRGPSWRHTGVHDTESLVQTNPMFTELTGGAHLPQKAHSQPAQPACTMSVPGPGAGSPNTNSTRQPSVKPSAGEGQAGTALTFAVEDIASRVALATGITAFMQDAALAKGAPSPPSSDPPLDLLAHLPPLMVVGAALGAGLASRASEALAHILPRASQPATWAALLALTSGVLLLKAVSSALASNALKALQSSSSLSFASKSLLDNKIGPLEGASQGTPAPLAECVPRVELATRDSETGAVRTSPPGLRIAAGSGVLLAEGRSHTGEVPGAASAPPLYACAAAALCTQMAQESAAQLSDCPRIGARAGFRAPIAGARGPGAARSVHLALVAAGFLETEVQSASFGVAPGEPLGSTPPDAPVVQSAHAEQPLANPVQRSGASSPEWCGAFSSMEAQPSFGVAPGESLLVRTNKDADKEADTKGDGEHTVHGQSEFFTPASSLASTPRGSPHRQAYADLLQSVLAPCAPVEAPSSPTAAMPADPNDFDSTPPSATPTLDAQPLPHSQVRFLRSSPGASPPCVSGARGAFIEEADFGVAPGSSLFADIDEPPAAAARMRRVASAPRGLPASARSRVLSDEPAKHTPAVMQTMPDTASNVSAMGNATPLLPTMLGTKGGQMTHDSRQCILRSKSVQELSGMLVKAVVKNASQQAAVVLEKARETIRDELRPLGVLGGAHMEARRAAHECVLHGEEHRSRLVATVQGLSRELIDTVGRAGTQATAAANKASAATSGLVRRRVAEHNRATAAATRAIETTRTRLSQAWASKSKALNVVHVAPLPPVSLAAASVCSDHVSHARERPVNADVQVTRTLGVHACKAILMEYISMHMSFCGFGLSKEKAMQADVLIQQLEAKNQQHDMQQLQGQWRVLYSTSEGMISKAGKPFAHPAHLAFNQSALVFEFKPPESRGFLSINRGGCFVSDLVRLDGMSYELRNERYSVARHYLGLGSASRVETSSTRVKTIKVTYIDHLHAILRHENNEISVLALINSDYICC